MNAAVRALLFDLDGTLVDSAPDMAAAVNRVLAEEGLPVASLERVRHWVGNGGRELVRRALAAGGDAAPGEDRVEAALQRFLHVYGERLCVDSALYPGCRSGLEQLRGDGYALACVTNKPEGLARRLLAALDLDGLLPVVVGGDTVDRRKPDPAPLHHAMAELGVVPAETLMIGDSRADVEGGRNAGCRVVCVPYGYSQGTAVEALGPDLVVGSIEELRRRLRGAA